MVEDPADLPTKAKKELPVGCTVDLLSAGVAVRAHI